MKHNTYAHLLGKNYEEITNDCLTLVSDFYNDIFGVKFPEYARPEDFFDPRLNMIQKVALDLGLSSRNLSRLFLQDGDILVFRCASDVANHVGVYVGNDLFIHQMVDSKGREDPLDERWFRRLTNIYFMPDVQSKLPKQDNWFSLLLES